MSDNFEDFREIAIDMNKQGQFEEPLVEALQLYIQCYDHLTELIDVLEMDDNHKGLLGVKKVAANAMSERYLQIVKEYQKRLFASQRSSEYP